METPAFETATTVDLVASLDRPSRVEQYGIACTQGEQAWLHSVGLEEVVIRQFAHDGCAVVVKLQNER
jgi:hypothetical protein